jgi:hypothetical protein
VRCPPPDPGLVCPEPDCGERLVVIESGAPMASGPVSSIHSMHLFKPVASRLWLSSGSAIADGPRSGFVYTPLCPKSQQRIC